LRFESQFISKAIWNASIGGIEKVLTVKI